MIDGCPEGMYPVDVKPGWYNKVENLDELIEICEDLSSPLNFPISWFITNNKSDATDKFEVMFLLPRKENVCSFYTHNFDVERAENWVKDFTYRAALVWYGWDE